MDSIIASANKYEMAFTWELLSRRAFQFVSVLCKPMDWIHVSVRDASHPTEPFTALRPKNLPINELRVVQKRRSADFKTLTLQNVRSGSQQANFSSTTNHYYIISHALLVLTQHF